MEKAKNIIEVTIKIEKKEFEEALDKALDKKIKKVKVDGFREGKLPKDMYYKKFGKESLYMDAVDLLLPSAFEKAIKDKYEPIIQPKVDIKSIDENGVELEFIITTKPEVKIKKYKGLKVKKQDTTVTKEEIKQELENILKKYSELSIKEGKVEKGDIAIIDFEGSKNGIPFEGGKGENYSLEIGSNTFIPGFEDQIIGMKKEEEKDIKVTFPKDYPSEDLKGQEVVFKVKVNEIKEKAIRELDAEFFEDLGMEGVNSKETLEAEIKANLEANKQMNIENQFIDELLKEISENTTVEIPEELLEDEINHMIERFAEQIKMQGASLEVYYQLTNTCEHDLREQMKNEAKSHVLYRFILDEIKILENIKATEKEALEEAEKIAKQYNMETEEFLKLYGDINMMIYEVEMKKVIDFLKENN